MDKFLKSVGVFLILPVVILLVSDTYLRNKNSLYNEKYKGAIENSKKIKLLILGNSHANYGVDPEPFDEYAYNIANVNQSFYFDKRITLSLLNKLKNLEYVLISADYHSMYFSSQGLRNFWSYRAHNITYENENYFWENLSPTLFGYPPKVVLSFLKRDLKNLLVHQNQGVNFTVQKGVNVLDTIDRGFIGYTGSIDDSFNENNYKKRANTFNKKILNANTDKKKEIENDLQNFIIKLKENGITPILFTAPTYQEYNKYLDSNSLKQNEIFYRKLSEEFDIPYWNFMDSNLFNKRLFYDEDHLNKKGAHRFSLILNDSIKFLSK